MFCKEILTKKSFTFLIFYAIIIFDMMKGGIFMAAKKQKDENKLLMYKGKPLVRKGNVIYYGNPDADYIAVLTENAYEEINGMKVATSVSVSLTTNATKGQGKEKVIKKPVERDGLYLALDIGEYWLSDELGEI